MANGLGRGLGSLIPQKTNKSAESNSTGDFSLADSKDKILKIAVEKIKMNPMQPRERFDDHSMEELVDSIKEYGIIQPLIATKNNNNYELIAGERRLRAARMIGLDKVPVIIRDAREQEKLELALVENIQRENLNAIELGEAYQRLIDEFGLKHEEVGKKVGKSRSSVANSLRILKLPEEIKLALMEGKITEGHAKYLIGLEGEEKQMSLFRKILRNNISVHDTGKEARRMGGTKHARIKINYADKDKEFALREFFGARVEIKRKGRGGQIIIDFYNDEELGEIINKVKP